MPRARIELATHGSSDHFALIIRRGIRLRGGWLIRADLRLAQGAASDASRSASSADAAAAQAIDRGPLLADEASYRRGTCSSVASISGAGLRPPRMQASAVGSSGDGAPRVRRRVGAVRPTSPMRRIESRHDEARNIVVARPRRGHTCPDATGLRFASFDSQRGRGPVSKRDAAPWRAASSAVQVARQRPPTDGARLQPVAAM